MLALIHHKSIAWWCVGLLAACMLLCTACEQSRRTPEFVETMDRGLIQWQDNNPAQWWVLRDDGARLWPDATSQSLYRPVLDERVSVVYMRGNQTKETFDLVVEVLRIYPIATYDIVEVNPAKSKLLIAEVVRVVDVRIIGPYLSVNVDYRSVAGDMPEPILLRDTSTLLPGARLYLQIKPQFNAGGGGGVVAPINRNFNLESLREAGNSKRNPGAISLVIHILEPGGVVHISRLTYSFQMMEPQH